MAMLSAPHIKEKHKEGRILIEPFNEEQLNPNSYDVRLGEYYARVVAPVTMVSNISPGTSIPAEWINLQSQEHHDERWEVFEAITVSNLMEAYPTSSYFGLSADDKAIIIEPMESILCNTEEFIGGADFTTTTLMKAKSTMGRNFLTVCHDAGFGDVGFHNRWAMRITNGNQQRVLLKVGMRVAQIAFFEVSRPVGTDYVYKGSYQNFEEELADLKANWKPEHMLPKVK